MAATITQQSITLKADFLPFTVLQLIDSDLEYLQLYLEKKINQAPMYFKNAPIIIDIAKVLPKDSLNLEMLCNMLKSFGIVPMGIKGLIKSQHPLALKQGLTILAGVSTKKKPSPQPLRKQTKPTEANYKLITKPVRAGTQVYAKGGDLTVMAAVNTGAECIADGSIHVYGPLRGKALAGAQGDSQARIFCEQLDAELISIAGNFLVRDQFNVPKTKKAMLQIYLSNNKLIIEGI